VSWLLVVWVCESWGAVFGLARPRYWAAPSENSRRGARGQSHPLHNGVETEEKWCVSPASARWKQFASPRGAPFVRRAMDEIKPNGHLGGAGTRLIMRAVPLRAAILSCRANYKLLNAK